MFSLHVFVLLAAAAVSGFAQSPITATPGAFRFVYTPAGTVPAPQLLNLGANSSVNFTFTVTGGGSWLTVSALSGTAPTSLYVSVNPASLGLGTYSATLTVNGSTLTIPVVLVVFAPGSASQIFADVPLNHPWLDYIYLLGRFGVTVGCTSIPLNYCPASGVTQEQMSAFIIRALLGETFSYAATPFYSDVPAGSLFFKYVQKMAELNINAGCGGGQFCSSSPVTRGQMAQYIIRARYGDNFTYPTAARFTDVPASDPLFSYVQKMWDLGITQGCTTATYCPSDSVNREQMAAFLTRAFFNYGQLTPAAAPTPPTPPPPTPPAPPAPPAPPPPIPPASGSAPQIGGCNIFPADNVWNTPVDTLPVHSSSAAWITTIGSTHGFHADFGSGLWAGGPIGIPFVVVPQGQARIPIVFDTWDESDAGPYPIPPNPPIEGGNSSDGDRHILILEQGVCKLWEIYSAYPQTDGSYTGGSGAVYDLKVNGPLRPQTWTSADAAGLPILPGLVRYDEMAAGEVKHAIRFTAPQSKKEFIWPARHQASKLTGSQYPPMGARFRLKASYDISGFSAQAQVLLKAMKKYGIMLADNGSSWYISGAPDERWNNDMLHEIDRVTGANMEAVDTSGVMIDVNSGQAKQ